MKRPTAGYTFIELLSVIAIIGVLVALLLPAVQAAREAARRSGCSDHLSQLVLAVQGYESAFGVYPPGTVNQTGPVRNLPQGYHHNWVTQILPYLEQRNAYRHVDFHVSVYHANNLPARQLGLEILRCPSASAWGRGYSSYAGVHHHLEAPIDADNSGVFYLNSRTRYDHLVDGTSWTLFIGEKHILLGDLGWMSGTRATLRNTGVAINTGAGLAWGTPLPLPGAAEQQPVADEELLSELFTNPRARWRFYNQDVGDDGLPEFVLPTDPLLAVGGFGSNHPGGSQFAVGDGSVRFFAESISLITFVQLGHRADRGLLDPPY